MALTLAFQRKLIYFPSRGPLPPAAAVIAGAQEKSLRTSDGLELGAWYVPARGFKRNFAVLVANGNGGDRSLRAPLADALTDQGLAVLLFDYRGYGGNPGHPGQDGLARDVRAARSFLVDEAGMPAGRLIYFGESLGAAVVTELAAQEPPAGLVLRSPFTDLTSLGRLHYPFLPVELLLRDRYPLVSHLAEVRCPVTVVHGTADTIVPPEQSRAVAGVLPGTRRIEVPGAGHNDLRLLDGPEVIGAIVDLARR
ncbi:alpha/beta hydrolase [Saccharopolyspora phatthalungensis]|nr:alpha/beta fold hydrolase [Saccharopolyspora phatthalungensis]